MKSKFTSFLILFLVFGTGARADTSVTLSRLKAVEKLEAEGKQSEAMRAAVRTIFKTESEIGVDQVVARIQDSLTENRRERVVGHHSSDEKLGLSVSGLLSLISGSISEDRTEDYDITQVITENPEEVAAFPEKASEDLARLRSDIVSYVERHSTEIAVIKILGAHYFRLAAEASDAGEPVDPNEMASVLRATESFHFFGEQDVSVCVRTEFASAESEKTAGDSASASLLGLLSFSGSGSSNVKEQKWAHIEMSCQSSVNQIESTPQDLVMNVDLTELDRIVRQWARVAALKNALSHANDDVFPTFGSPEYRN